MAKRARIVKSNASAARTTTRREAEAQFNRKKQQQRMRQLRRRCMLIGGGVAFVTAAFLSYQIEHSGALQRWAQQLSTSAWSLTADAGFKVNQVYLYGRAHANAAAVKKAISIQSGAPILQLPLKEIEGRLEAIPEVKSVVISRALPDTITITLTERQPVALWQRGATHTLVDGDGVILTKEYYPAIGKLPVIVGQDAPNHVRELTAMLASEPLVQEDVVAAVRVGQRRWDVQLKRGITVMLPQENPSAAWKRFAALAKKDGLLNKAIRSVDMRIEDRVFIMPVAQQKSMMTLTNAKET